LKKRKEIDRKAKSVQSQQAQSTLLPLDAFQIILQRPDLVISLPDFSSIRSNFRDLVVFQFAFEQMLLRPYLLPDSALALSMFTFLPYCKNLNIFGPTIQDEFISFYRGKTT
jgi:hypothetical protein